MIYKRTGRWRLALMLALMSSMCMPLSASAEEGETAEAVDAVDAEEVVDPEVNEDSLRYLLLVDTFETAERIPTRRLATPADVVVITAEEIDANHYQSVDEALSHVTGMIMSFINGSDRVLTLVDGRRSFMTPPMKAIDRIEIVKGGGSALYGSDAVGGVINIITKKGDHNETTFDVNTGSWHRHTYEVTNQGNDGKLGWFVDAGIGRSRAYNFRGAEGAVEEQSSYDNNWASLRLDHQFNDRSSLTLDIMHRSNRTLPLYSLHDYGLQNQISLAYSFKEGTATPGFLRYFNNYNSFDDTDSGRGNSRLQGVDYQNGWEMGQHKFIVGAEWHQSADQNDRWNNEKKKSTNQAYYLQDTISMGQKWTLVPGTRFDNNSQYGHQWSPKLAANYQPDDQTKIYASWGRVYQAPNARQLYTNWAQYAAYDEIPYYYVNWIGDKNLEPETGHTETIGIEHDFSDKVNASLSLFKTNVGDYLDLNDNVTELTNTHSPDGSGILKWGSLNYVNANKDKQHGVNLMYRQKIDDHWSYNVGYAYTHRDRHLGSEEFLAHWYAPKNSYKASIRYQNGPWKVTLHGMFGSGSSGDNYMKDDFAMLDFNISCEITEWATVYAKAINFTNQNRSYYGSNVNAPGRLVQFGLDCYF